MDPNGQERTETSTFEHYYANDDSWTYLGGQETRNGETTQWDANWNEIGRTVDMTGLTTQLTEDDGIAYDLFGAAYFKTDTFTDWNGQQATETTYLNAQGTKLGSSNTNTNTFTDWNGAEITSTNINYNGPNWTWLGSEWTDSNGNSGWNTRTAGVEITFDFDGDPETADTTQIVQVERGENTNTWMEGDQQRTETSTFEHYYVNDDSWTYLGGQETRNGETTKWDANWNEISRTVDTSGLTETLIDADGLAFDLYGAAYYKTNTWTDWNGSEASETTYFSESGAKLGSSNTNTNTWTDWNGAEITSTNTNYNGPNGNWWGSEWSDSNNNSGWNTRTAGVEITFDFDGDPETADTTQIVLVERGENTNTWMDGEQQRMETSTFVYYYANDDTMTFLGGQETRNGETTQWDANWNEIGRTVDLTGVTDQLTSEDGIAYDLFGAALYKVDSYGNTDYYDAGTGAKVGSSNTNTWTDDTFTSTNTNYNDANWNWLGSEWSDSNDNSGWSTRTVEEITFDFDGNPATEDTTQTVQVERGENTWMSGTQTETSIFEHYYADDDNWTFLGGQETRNGETIKLDANWNVIGGDQSQPSSFTVTLDTNPADTLIGTFAPDENQQVELHDLDGDGTIDQMTMTESWLDNNNQPQSWSETFVVVWDDNLTDWTAYYTESFDFSGYDDFGRPESIMIDGTAQPITWFAEPVDGVMGSLSFSETWDDDSTHQIELSLVETDAEPDGIPNEIWIKEDGVDAGVMLVTGMVFDEGTGLLPVSMTIQAAPGSSGDDVLQGSAVFGTSGIIETVSLAPAGDPVDDTTNPPDASDDTTEPPATSDSFTVTLDTNPADTLIGTFAPDENQQVELHDLDGDGTIDQMTMTESWLDNNNQPQSWSETFVVVWDDNLTDWTAYYTESFDFSGYDDFGRPESIMIDGTAQPITWFAEPVDGVMGSLSFSETWDDDSTHQIELSLVETDAEPDGIPNEIWIKEDGVDAGVMLVTGMVFDEGTGLLPVSMTIQAAPGSSGDDVLQGSAVFGTSGIIETVSLAPAGDPVDDTTNPPDASDDTTAPSNIRAYFSGPDATITLVFDEPVYSGSSDSGVLHAIKYSNLYSGSEFWSMGESISILDMSGTGTDTITFTTDATFASTDVLSLQYDSSGGGLVDAAGNVAPSAEIWIGSSGPSIIDLDYHEGMYPITIRGNGGDDVLIGTDDNDLLIDGPGADILLGSGGADKIRLIEDGIEWAFSRDSVIIEYRDDLGGSESQLGEGQYDGIGGFDITSADPDLHDTLGLPSGLIAADASHVLGTAATGDITSHSIVDGIVTFHDAADTDVLIDAAINIGDAVGYLAGNINEVGASVAFKFDSDGNGGIDSLAVFQDSGSLALYPSGLPDTFVVMRYLDGIDQAVLGTSPGAYVVEITDIQGPEALDYAYDMTLGNTGFTLEFMEKTYVNNSLLALSFTNGATNEDITYMITGNDSDWTAGSPSQSWTVTFDTPLADDDWFLGLYNPISAEEGFADAAGNFMESDDMPWAQGMAGDNTIDVSNLPGGTSADGYDIFGGAGDDTLVGSDFDDYIGGGAGADIVTGGLGSDEFFFNQGHSPAITWTDTDDSLSLNAGDTLTFDGGKADVITDYNSIDEGDTLALDMPMSNADATAGMPISDSDMTMTQGSFDDANGTFTVGYSASDMDTLLIYDGDPGSAVALTGLVLTGVIPELVTIYT